MNDHSENQDSSISGVVTGDQQVNRGLKSKNILILISAGLVIIAFVLYFYFGFKFLEGQSGSGNSLSPRIYKNNNFESVVSSSIVVNNIITDNKVNVLNTKLKEPGFIVVYKDNNGSYGKEIGVSQLLNAGEFSDIYIPLEEEVTEGEKLYVVIQKDDGDREYVSNADLIFNGNETPVTAVITAIVLKVL
ncbi:hypothetical protein ACFL25_00635 [Patescibacteria group bacterium]